MSKFLQFLGAVALFYLIYKYIRLLIKANKLEHEFTSIVNHTFRTPLTRIMWLTKELEKDLPAKDRLLLLQNVTNATNQVLEIVDLFMGIKNINNTSTYFFEAISIRDIVEKSITKYREEINKRHITFQVPTFKDIPLLTVDLKKVSFVVDSLIENAIVYSKKDSKVYIECKTTNRSFILIVRDDGIGLTWMEKFRIFNKFYRSKRAILMYPDGMGLRLYLSQQIIKRHRGTLYAISNGKDQGTKFFMEVPYS